MRIQNVFAQLKFWDECRRYGLTWWQCPNTLVLIMGVFTIAVILATYQITRQDQSPEIIIGSVVLVAIFVLVVSYLVVRTFEELARANMLKTDFVSIASHQLRTPLTTARWTLNLLTRKYADGLSEKQKGFIDSVQENNDRMAKLVRDLLNVSRIDQGRFSLREEKVNMSEVARSLIRSLEPYARANGAKLELRLSQKDLYILGDDSYTKLVLENLIDNAIRYSSKQDTIRISVASRGGMVRTEVQDNGVGIPKADQRHIFDKFFRSKNAMHLQTEGTGIGLFVARAAVVGMDGTMGFRSEEGRGSTFWFELPTA